MAQPTVPNTYTQGYAESSIASHLVRTAETDAAFLIPHIKSTDLILDVGCGPGTITTTLAKYVPQGKVTGIDIGDAILEKARSLAQEKNIHAEGPGSVVFEAASATQLPFPDASFHIVYSSQLFPHLPPPDLPLAVMKEMQRVLRPGGILATRAAADLHFYPREFDLDRLWARNMARGLGGGAPGADLPGATMPLLYRRAGLGVGDARIVVGAGTTVHAGAEQRRWYVDAGLGRLQEGHSIRESWLAAGVTEEEIGQTVAALKAWGATDHAWYVAVQSEILAWKPEVHKTDGAEPM